LEKTRTNWGGGGYDSGRKRDRRNPRPDEKTGRDRETPQGVKSPKPTPLGVFWEKVGGGERDGVSLKADGGCELTVRKVRTSNTNGQPQIGAKEN